MSMNRNPSLTYTYDDKGRLLEVEDCDIRTTTQYTYDNTNRLVGYAVYDQGENLIFSSKVSYNILGNVESLSEKVKAKKFFTEYSYDLNNNLTGFTTSWGSSSDGYFDDETRSQLYTYDGIGRVTQITTKEINTSVITTSLLYKVPDSTYENTMGVGTSNVLAVWENEYGETTTSYHYKYDANGNITEISPDSSFTNSNGVKYTYDKLNQLIRVDDANNNETWVYTYDLAGNITSKKKYAYTRGTLGSVLQTISYGYTDSTWNDLLTSYNGKTITYDEIGNPLSDGTWEYDWDRGRQLMSMENASTGWEFTYDANGQRLTKSNGTLTYHYIYDGIQLRYLKVTQNNSTICEMYFEYGQTGLMAIQYISSSLTDTYYAVTNAQGDVVALVDGSGTVVVNYTYDAWGKLKSMTGSKASTVGKYNPIRYRGYVYDTETQLYYLNTRYYNPDMGRFINADSYASTGDELVGRNMFAYCGNNPIMYSDETGHMPEWIGDILLGLVIIAGVAFVATALTFSGGTAAAFLPAFGKTVLVGLQIATAAGATSGLIRTGRSLAKNIGEGNGFSETMTNAGKSFLAGFGDGFFAGSAYNMATAVASLDGYRFLGSFNNGYGVDMPNCMIGYQNTNVYGFTFYASKTGKKLRVEMDPAHSIHYHRGKTKSQRSIHKGYWIGGIIIGIYTGFDGEVY